MAEVSEERIYEALETVYASVKGLAREIRPDVRLREDLDIDSLDAIEMLTELEDELGESLLEHVTEQFGGLDKASDFVAVISSALE